MLKDRPLSVGKCYQTFHVNHDVPEVVALLQEWVKRHDVKMAKGEVVECAIRVVAHLALSGALRFEHFDILWGGLGYQGPELPGKAEALLDVAIGATLPTPAEAFGPEVGREWRESSYELVTPNQPEPDEAVRGEAYQAAEREKEGG